MTFRKGTPDVRPAIVCDAPAGVEPGTLRTLTCSEEFSASDPQARLGFTAGGLREAAHEYAGWSRVRKRGPASPAEDRCPKHRPLRVHNAGQRGGFR